MLDYFFRYWYSTVLLFPGSDGQLFSLDLPTQSVGGTTHFPGRVLTNLSALSPRHQTAILPLSTTHVAIYGADSSEEGNFNFNTFLYFLSLFGF